MVVFPALFPMEGAPLGLSLVAGVLALDRFPEACEQLTVLLDFLGWGCCGCLCFKIFEIGPSVTFVSPIIFPEHLTHLHSLECAKLRSLEKPPK